MLVFLGFMFLALGIGLTAKQIGSKELAIMLICATVVAGIYYFLPVAM